MHTIFLTLLMSIQFSTTMAHAACEGLLRGLRVESEFAIGDPWKATYFEIASNYLRAKATVGVHFDQCTTVECKTKLDLISNAKWEHHLLKFSVNESTCSDIWSYFILMDGGGTAEFLDILKLTTVEVDSTYPF